MANMIVSIIILVIIIFLEMINCKKYPEKTTGELHNKYKKLLKKLYILSIIAFIIIFIIGIISEGFSLKTIIDAISFLIITLPLSLNHLYNICFENDKHIEYTKTIVTNKFYSIKDIKKLNKAGINVIILSSKKTDLKLKTITEKEIPTSKLNKNLIIKTTNLNIIEHNEDFYYDFSEENTINLLTLSRGKHDNFIRTIKFNITTNIILIVPYIFFHIIGFPITYKLSFALSYKLIMILISNYLYPKLPYDTDIMDRSVKPKEILIGKQELSLSIIQSFLVIFALTIPYMYLLASGATIELVNTIFLIGFTYSLLFITIINLSEKLFILNLIQCFKSIKLTMMIITTILMSLFIYFIPLFNTKPISLQNYISTILIVLIFTLIFDITKFARYTTTKRSKKNGNKNNKKYRRS